ncbi:MAG: phosphatidate cytidylyltransferase [Firmicutes bacterium]|jgi:phosphatidate cytidylyltransferase|nr:phosphatidate cytidylyltransferase [Bacillota bacterium]
MMRARVLVGLIGAPIGICVLWMGGAPLALVAAIIAAIGGVEYARMCRTKAWTPSQPLISVGSALFVVDAVANNGAYCGPLLALVLAFSLGRQVLGATPTGSMAVPALEVFGVVYCGWTLSRFCLIRGAFGEAGLGLSLLVLVLVWLNDMGAFFTGRAFGRRKLSPRMSPNKTVEGSVGGFLWAVAGSAAHKMLGELTGLWYTLNWPQAIIFAVLIAACSQIGDLAESGMKRDAGVKDAGKMFPGHGGVLDRFDSFFFVSPIAYYYLRLML